MYTLQLFNESGTNGSRTTQMGIPCKTVRQALWEFALWVDDMQQKGPGVAYGHLYSNGKQQHFLSVGPTGDLRCNSINAI
jgi:hypothetical protein